jgi:hypothetical protein
MLHERGTSAPVTGIDRTSRGSLHLAICWNRSVRSFDHNLPVLMSALTLRMKDS